MKIFPGGRLPFIKYCRQRWKATTATLLSPIFWLHGHIRNQKLLWELFTQDGTDQPHWLMDYQALHPSHEGQHCGRGCFVHQTNTYLGHHRLNEQCSLCRRLAEEFLNFAHMNLNSPCLVVDGWPLAAQPWQPDLGRSMYVLLKSSGMYPSDWSNGMSADQFMGDSMLLSWDLTPDDSGGVAYLSPRRLGMVKASPRFARPLPATTTLIANAQYNNLVVINAYHTVTFDYIPWCLAGNF